MKAGKLNILIDGQFGSTGKGLVASYLGYSEHVDIAITNSSPNAGHTFYDWYDKKCVTHHLPVTGILQKRSTIYLCAGSIIDPDILLEEMELFDIDPTRVRVHPRAAVVEDIDRRREAKGRMVEISSTQKGVGSALSRKILRESRLAGSDSRLKDVIGTFDVQEHLDWGCTAIIEVPQGMDLSINTGLAYPYCTSREISVSCALSDVDVHPDYLGDVYACIRTYPIRVGNGDGYSGPFWNDSEETSWEKIGVAPEKTTNTNKIRRVATFSLGQYRKMINKFRPSYVFLNFANYLKDDELEILLEDLDEITHLGFGPRYENVEWR